MLYAMLCYNSEEIVGSWSKAEDDAMMARLDAIRERLTREGKLGPVARLMDTTAAVTLRKAGRGRRLEASDEPATVTDGPFAETKEQLLGFYVLDCANLDEALAIARELGQENPGGAYEIRPLRLFFPGAVPAATPGARRP
jgi:hypothetical protein